MYRRLLALAFGTFAVGTDSFVIAGILPRIATTLHSNVTSAGQLITVFAIAYAVMSPVMAAVTATWPRKTVMLTGLAVLAAGNALTAVLPSLGLVMVARIIAGIGAGMYTPTATTAAATIAPPEQRGRALAIVVAGLSAATALGAPIGTLIGSLGPWQNTMWFVVALCVVSGIGLVALLPAVPLLPKVGLAKRLAPIGDSAIGLTLLTTVLVYAGLYIVYNYIAVSYDRVTLGSGTTLAILLFVWGVAATLGNFVAGNLTDKFGNRTVVNVAIAVALLDFALMPLASAHLVSAVIAIVVWGLCGWGALVPQQHRLFQAAGPAGAALAISLNGAALFVAVSVSGLLGAAGINLFGAHQLGFAGAVFLLLGLVCAEGAWAIIAQRKAAAAAEAATVTAARTGGSATIDPVAKR